MPPTFQRVVRRNVPDYLPVAGEVERFCAAHGLSRAVSFKVCLILEEVVLNLIEHATGAATDRINVRIDLEPDQVILDVEDDSDPFDPHAAPAFDPARPLEERGPRGMGIHLVRTMVDDFVYERIDGGNRLRVVLAR
jgi:anti-sigma regulatory factor (Ser/Thr protein kinase)